MVRIANAAAITGRVTEVSIHHRSGWDDKWTGPADDDAVAVALMERASMQAQNSQLSNALASIRALDHATDALHVASVMERDVWAQLGIELRATFVVNVTGQPIELSTDGYFAI